MMTETSISSGTLLAAIRSGTATVDYDSEQEAPTVWQT